MTPSTRATAPRCATVPARLVAPEIGLDTLFALASDHVRAANPDLDWRRCEPSRLGPGLVAGTAEPGEAEVLRLHNATWVEARAPRLDPRRSRPLGRRGFRRPTVRSTATFLVTPLAASLADALATRSRRPRRRHGSCPRRRSPAARCVPDA